MKKRFFLLVIFKTFFLVEAYVPTFSYLGSFEFVDVPSYKKAPLIPVYYKGALIPVEKRSYLFTDHQRFSTITLIVSLLDQPKSNTIAHFSVPKNEPYLVLTAMRKTKQFALKKGEVFQETWTIQTKEGVGPFIVPQDAVIVLIDPTCVKEIKNVTWVRDSFVTQLPTLVFQKDIMYSEKHAQSLFAKLDICAFHKESEQIIYQQTQKSESSQRVIV